MKFLVAMEMMVLLYVETNLEQVSLIYLTKREMKSLSDPPLSSPLSLLCPSIFPCIPTDVYVK